MQLYFSISRYECRYFFIMVIIIIVFKVSFLFHIEVRILESPGLEKAFKTTKFSHHELLSSITKPRPLVSCLHITNTSRDEDSAISPGNPIPMLGHPLHEEILPKYNLNLSWHNLRSLPHILSLIM